MYLPVEEAFSLTILEKRGDGKLGKPVIVLLSVALGVISIFIVCLL
jgi:hypothetical protein